MSSQDKLRHRCGELLVPEAQNSSSAIPFCLVAVPPRAWSRARGASGTVGGVGLRRVNSLHLVVGTCLVVALHFRTTEEKAKHGAN